jgi:stearoyl-CoA desaturase (delta-9 desaturase)
LIGYFAHNRGGMRYRVQPAAVQGRNIPFTSLLTMGECWHNNHHAFPGSARLGLYPGEWDPGWWALMLFRKVGLVWGTRLPPDLPARPELEVDFRPPANVASEPVIETPAASVALRLSTGAPRLVLRMVFKDARRTLHME